MPTPAKIDSIGQLVELWDLENCHRDKFQQVMDLIDAVHRVDGPADPPEIHLKDMNPRRYHEAEDEWDRGICNRSNQDPVAPNIPRKIASVEICPKAPDPYFTIAHEFGHCVDYWILLAIHVNGSDHCERQYQSLSRAIKSTQEVRELIAAKRGNEDPVVMAAKREQLGKNWWQLLRQGIRRKLKQSNLSEYSPLSVQSAKRINYLLEDDELFARAYSQYLVTKTRDSQLGTEFNERSSTPITQYAEYWDDSSFREILKAFDSLFVCLSWLKPVN